MRKHRVGIVVTLALGALLLGQQLVQRHRHTTAVRVMSELVAALRTGEARDGVGLDQDDPAPDRAWMSSRFTVLCDRVPPVSWTRYECVARFEGGGSVYSDVDTSTGRTQGARLVPPRH